jgi:hypothetical protein
MVMDIVMKMTIVTRRLVDGTTGNKVVDVVVVVDDRDIMRLLDASDAGHDDSSVSFLQCDLCRPTMRGVFLIILLVVGHENDDVIGANLCRS